jgi:hypothetical protein
MHNTSYMGAQLIGMRLKERRAPLTQACISSANYYGDRPTAAPNRNAKFGRVSGKASVCAPRVIPPQSCSDPEVGSLIHPLTIALAVRTPERIRGPQS